MGSCFSSDQQHKPDRVGVRFWVKEPVSLRPWEHAKTKSSTRANPKFPSSQNMREPNKKDEKGKGTPVKRRTVVELRENPGNNDLHIFTYEELSCATKQFCQDRILGDGGFGMVYKGEIYVKGKDSYYTMPVAIKKLNPEGFQGDQEWMLVESAHLSLHSRANALVLYHQNGESLNWARRMKIALDAAKGLACLHDNEKLLYRDFKTSNILLDKDFNAKISDFGLVKNAPVGDQTHVSTRVMGTYGYAAPEYISTGHLTAKNDVYAFGVVLLELLTGRAAIDRNRSPIEEKLVDFALPRLVDYKKLRPILDPRLKGQYRQKDIGPVVILAFKCLSNEARDRPVMKEVVHILEAAKS
ncbi:hypothetical protein LguiB_005423 [Lonicera macranthoides]